MRAQIDTIAAVEREIEQVRREQERDLDALARERREIEVEGTFHVVNQGNDPVFVQMSGGGYWLQPTDVLEYDPMHYADWRAPDGTLYVGV